MTRSEKKKLNQEREAAIPAFLRENGWTQSEVDPNVWSKPNWEYPEGNCVRTLKQAYKIQYALSAQEVAA